MSVQLPPCPATLKAIQHYLNTAVEHDQRDPVVSYWCKYCIESVGRKSFSDDGGDKVYFEVMY
jgi:vacuolar protein sorting-associated protein VTA1